MLYNVGQVKTSFFFLVSFFFFNLAQAGLKLRIFLSQPLNYWNDRNAPPRLTLGNAILEKNIKDNQS